MSKNHKPTQAKSLSLAEKCSVLWTSQDIAWVLRSLSSLGRFRINIRTWTLIYKTNAAGIKCCYGLMSLCSKPGSRCHSSGLGSTQREYVSSCLSWGCFGCSLTRAKLQQLCLNAQILKENKMQPTNPNAHTIVMVQISKHMDMQSRRTPLWHD